MYTFDVPEILWEAGFDMLEVGNCTFSSYIPIVPEIINFDIIRNKDTISILTQLYIIYFVIS